MRTFVFIGYKIIYADEVASHFELQSRRIIWIITSFSAKISIQEEFYMTKPLTSVPTLVTERLILRGHGLGRLTATSTKLTAKRTKVNDRRGSKPDLANVSP